MAAAIHRIINSYYVDETEHEWVSITKAFSYHSFASSRACCSRYLHGVIFLWNMSIFRLFHNLHNIQRGKSCGILGYLKDNIEDMHLSFHLALLGIIKSYIWDIQGPQYWLSISTVWQHLWHWALFVMCRRWRLLRVAKLPDNNRHIKCYIFLGKSFFQTPW